MTSTGFLKKSGGEITGDFSPENVHFACTLAINLVLDSEA